MIKTAVFSVIVISVNFFTYGRGGEIIIHEKICFFLISLIFILKNTIDYEKKSYYVKNINFFQIIIILYVKFIADSSEFRFAYMVLHQILCDIDLFICIL